MLNKRSSYKLIISAGEVSGDLLGAHLFQEIRLLVPEVEAWGMTGKKMQEAGVHSLYSIESLSVMGISAVLKKLPQIKRLMSDFLQKVDEIKPDLAIFIDSPAFHLRLSEKLRLRGIKTILYVAPQVWAWGQSRVYSLKSKVDHILGILPFETAFFSKYEVPYTYVGSPVYERISKTGVPILQKRKNIIGFFPGSRCEEFSYLFPIMLQVAKQLVRFGFSSVIHIAPNFKPEFVEVVLGRLGVSITEKIKLCYRNKVIKSVCLDYGSALSLMASVRFALVASGTACLECALLETPLAVIYKTSRLNYFLACLLIKTRYLSLPNLIANKKIVEEFIQYLEVDVILQHI